MQCYFDFAVKMLTPTSSAQYNNMLLFLPFCVSHDLTAVQFFILILFLDILVHHRTLHV